MEFFLRVTIICKHYHIAQHDHLRAKIFSFNTVLPLYEITLDHFVIFNPREHEIAFTKSHHMSLGLVAILYNKG